MADLTKPSNWDLRYQGSGRCPTRNGGELYYEVTGDGEPVVCLNNFFIVAPAWRNFTPNLSQRYSIVTWDLQNQGASSQPGGKHTFADHTTDLIDLLDHLGIARAHLLGTSISTLICLNAAVEHPDRVRSLVLAGPAFSPYGSLRIRLIFKDWLARLAHGGAAAVFDYLYPLVFSDTGVERGGRAAYLGLREHFLALNSEAQVRCHIKSALDAEAGPDLLRRVRHPSLLLLGDDDYLWCERTLGDACALMHDAAGHVIPGTGHMPFVEAVEAFEDAVDAFLRWGTGAYRDQAAQRATGT